MSDEQVYYEFSEFGKYIWYAGIFFIVSFFTSFIGSIGVLVVLLMGLQRIKSVNQRLHNQLLDEFYSRLLAAQIIAIVGSLVIFIGVISFYVAFLSTGGFTSMGMASSTSIPANPMTYVFSILGSLLIPLIIGGIIEFVGYGLAYSAWGKLQLFFEQSQIFPSGIRQSAADNAGKLKTASLMSLLSFLIITACIGLIFYIIGYFGLGGDLKNLKENTYQAQPSRGWGNQPPAQSQKITTPKTGALQPRFCPKCGTPLKEPVKYCPVCGNQLKD